MTITSTQIKKLAAKAVTGLGTFFKLTPDQEMTDSMSPADAAEVCIVAIIKEALALDRRAYGDAPLVLDPRWKWAYLNHGNKFVSENEPAPIGAAGFFAATRYDMASYLPDLGSPEESLHQIINGKLVKYQWVPGDNEPVMVRRPDEIDWFRYYSAGEVKEGWLVCYPEGTTKWSNTGCRTCWKHRRKPTEEELK